MKTCLVQGLALLLMVGALYGQSSQSTSQPAERQGSHDQMQMPGMPGQTTDQNRSPAQNQQMPGTQMPRAPEQPKQPQPPAGQQQMRGMQMPRIRGAGPPWPTPGPVYTLEQLHQLAVDHNPARLPSQAE